jgi:hypothetical protein
MSPCCKHYSLNLRLYQDLSRGEKNREKRNKKEKEKRERAKKQEQKQRGII